MDASMEGIWVVFPAISNIIFPNCHLVMMMPALRRQTLVPTLFAAGLERVSMTR
jgi:hypothetical protein